MKPRTLLAIFAFALLVVTPARSDTRKQSVTSIVTEDRTATVSEIQEIQSVFYFTRTPEGPSVQEPQKHLSNNPTTNKITYCNPEKTKVEYMYGNIRIALG